MIVFDASTLVSAALKIDSIPERALLRAETIVSSDNDLLVLNPWRGVKILNPVDYLASLA